MTAPPQNIEAEENVLGAALLSPGALEAAAEVLRPSDFFRPSHGIIFSTALQLHNEGRSVDRITLVDALEADGALKAAGGSSRIAELAALAPSTSNAGHHALIVKEQADLRNLLAAGEAIRSLAIDRGGDADELMARAEEILSQAVDPTITTQFAPLSDELAELAEEIEEAVATGKPRWGLRTGFVDLDRNTLGLHPGQLVLIAARPAMGKSALAQNIAENVADTGVNAGLVSLEMSKRELLLRSLARASGISSQKLRAGTLSPPEMEKYTGAKAAVARRRTTLHAQDSTDVTPTTLRAQARRLQRQQNLGVLVIDYLQLMLSGRATNDDNRSQEIGAISRSLKLLARDLNIPIIALSQLNRNLEYRADKRPQLADLRDSGSLEQDADVILFIYRDDYYNKESEQQGVAEVIVAKNRMGPTSTCKLAFNARATSFLNLAQGVTQ